jgi:hypothetical protein
MPTAQGNEPRTSAYNSYIKDLSCSTQSPSRWGFQFLQPTNAPLYFCSIHPTYVLAETYVGWIEQK